MPVVGSQYKGTVYTLPGCGIRYLCLFSDEAPPVPAGDLEGFTLAALSGSPAHAIQRGIVAEYLTPAADQAPEFRGTYARILRELCNGAVLEGMAYGQKMLVEFV